MRSTLCTLAAVVLLLVACGPDYPNDEYHQDATDEECGQCHILRSPPTPEIPITDIPYAPDSHFDGDFAKSSYEECQSCHDMQ